MGSRPRERWWNWPEEAAAKQNPSRPRSSRTWSSSTTSPVTLLDAVLPDTADLKPDVSGKILRGREGEGGKEVVDIPMFVVLLFSIVGQTEAGAVQHPSSAHSHS
eukprot:TRINITY_DN11219_c0_g2_i1.p1 TRINITY_DN11219_c0_g2~~TRINITY_DN11219_c0_g2_i1.p1  ORF type:complete len:105 (-),score=14.18 TRINITY_DN11219_c0_g2_i1:61-375(-)